MAENVSMGVSGFRKGLQGFLSGLKRGQRGLLPELKKAVLGARIRGTLGDIDPFSKVRLLREP